MNRKRCEVRDFTLIELPVVSRVKSRTFTLIELLVVIAIIGILASMLLPALSMAKKSAGRIQCASNMKTAATSVQLYANAFDSYIVQFSGTIVEWSIDHKLWMQYLGYLKMGYPSKLSGLSREMAPYQCPEVPRSVYTNSDKGYYCWTFNQYSAYNSNSTNWKNFRSIHTPSGTLFLADVADTTNPKTFNYGYLLYSNPETNTTRARITARHGGRTANILYFDGHVDTGFNPFDAPKNDHTVFWRGER